MGCFSYRLLGIFGYFFRSERATRSSSRASFRALGIARSARPAPAIPLAAAGRVHSQVTSGGSSSRVSGRSAAPRRSSANRRPQSRRPGSRGGWWNRGRRSRPVTRLRAEALETRKMLAVADLDAYTPVLAAGFDTGYSATDGITNIVEPTIELNLGAVTINPGDILQIAGLPGGPYQVTAPATGANLFVIPALNDGTYSVTVEMLDSTNAAGQPSQALTLVIDTVAPEVALVVTPARAVYAPGERMNFSVELNEPGYFSGSPLLELLVGSDPSLVAPDNPRQAGDSPVPGAPTPLLADGTGGTQNNSLRFSYVVDPTDNNDANGVQLQGSLTTLPGPDDIFDLAGNSVITAIPAGPLGAANNAMAAQVFVLTTNPAASAWTQIAHPRVTPVPTMTIAFTDKITGLPVAVPFPAAPPASPPSPPFGTGVLELADFRLTRNGTLVPLTGVVISAPIAGADAYSRYQLAGLEDITDLPGTYTLTFSDLGIAESAVISWSKDYTTPGELRATFTAGPNADIKDNVTGAPVNRITVRFTDAAGAINGVYDPTDLVVPVTGVIARSTPSREQFALYRDGQLIEDFYKSPIAVSGTGSTYTITGLSGLTNQEGAYELILWDRDPASGNWNGISSLFDSDSSGQTPTGTPPSSALKAAESIKWNFEPPVAITSVAPVSLPPSGFFRVGDVIEFDVTFSEPVFVTNPQFITLPIFLGTGTAGGPNNTVQAAYVSGDATNSLRFRYLPLPTDQDLDGILLSGSLSLGTGTSLGTIRDSAGIDAVLSYTQPNTTLLRIDSRAPQIIGVTGPANGTYGVGEALVFQVTFDESLVVSGTPRIPLVIGIQTVYADIIAGQETPTLIFQYVIQSGDNDTDGIIASSQIALNGGAVGDIAGNPALLTFAPLNLSGVRIDTAPPPAPVILGVFADNSGADLLVPDGGSTSDNALKLSGTAEPASVVTVFVNDVAYGQVTTPATGLWEFTTFTLASVLPTGNQYLFTAQAKDALNNIGPVSASYTVFVDTTPPSAPSVNPLITLNPRPTLTGAAVLLAGETLTVTISGEDGFVSFAYPVVPDDNGGWSLDLSTAVPVFSALAEGTYAVTATATDAAGNFTTDPTTSELVVDTSPVTVDVLQTNNPQPLITGTAVVPTGGRLEVTVNGQTYVVPVTSEGVWQLNLATAVPAFTPLADGIYSVSATVYDPSGTSLSDPTTDELQIDTTGPVVLAVDSLTPDGFYRAGDRINIQVTFADDVVVETTFGLPRLALNTGRTAVYVPEASNARVLTFSYVVQAGDNTDDLDYPTIAALSPNGATIRDGAGNDAELTLPIPGGPNSLGFNRSITIDTTPPSPPPTVDPLTTNNPLPTITGSAVLDTGELLTVTVSGTTFPVFPNADGRWTLDLSLANPLPDSPPLQPLAAGLRYNVIAAITDAAGNSTTDQTSNELAINSFAPLILGAIDDVQPGVGVLPSGRATNDPTPTLVGSANPDFLITISVETSSDGASSAFPIGTTISDSQGNWSFTPTSDLADGDYTFLIESTAAAGGTSIKGVVPFLLRVDTQQPTIAGITVAPKIYRAGDTIPITVSFNEAVRVSGKPELTFTIGTETETVTRIATYATGNGTSTLVFTYNIRATDLNDVDGVVVNSVSLPTSDATIRDAAANDADLAIANTTLAGDVFLMPRTATPSFTLFPTVRVNPRATPVSVVRLSFDNPVPYVLNASGTDGEDAVALLSLADFELTHNGNLVAFPPEARLIQSSSGTDFEISNLSAVTETVGTYILTFADRQIGPHQAYTWTKTDVTPAEVTAAITLTSSGGPLAPVDSATIVFSENVDNVDLSDFELRRDGAVLPWTGSGIVLSAADAGATYRLTGLEALTGVNGVYQLTLLADNQSTPQQESDIVSYTGGQLIGSVSRSWSFTRSVQIAANGITASVPPASGIFSKGDAVVFTVRFTEPVYSSATADLNMPLTIGNRIVPATYISGDGSDTITFAYLVQPGDSDLDGITLQGTLNLGSGTLRNAQGRDASVVFTPPNTTGLLVDGIDPTLDRVVLAANRGLYSTGQILRFTATFSEPMRVAGEPRIVLTVGTAKRYATYVTGDQTNVLVFEYQVQAGDDAPGGIVAASYISRNKGAVTDLAGNACDLNFTPLDLTGVRIDNGPPTVTGVATTVADGHYKAGDVIPLTVSVSETVIAGSSLTLVLDTGANILVVAEAAGTQLMGRYTVRAGDSSSRLDVTALSNPSVRDLGGTPMTATEFPSTIHKLAGTRAIVIDTTAPVAPSVTPLATSNRLPVLQGTAYPAAGETLRVEVAGLVFSNVPVDLLGRWSVNLATLQPSIGTALPLADGPYTVTAQLLDLAGNAGSGSAVLSIDTIPTVASAAGWGNSLANPPRLPRSSNIVTIVFNEPVTGFTTNDVRLFYEGRSVSIAGAALTGSGTTYTLSLPTRALALAGLYRLDIGGVGTGIRDSNLAVMSSASSLYAYLF